MIRTKLWYASMKKKTKIINNHENTKRLPSGDFAHRYLVGAPGPRVTVGTGQHMAVAAVQKKCGRRMFLIVFRTCVRTRVPEKFRSNRFIVFVSETWRDKNSKKIIVSKRQRFTYLYCTLNPLRGVHYREVHGTAGKRGLVESVAWIIVAIEWNYKNCYISITLSNRILIFNNSAALLSANVSNRYCVQHLRRI